MQSLADGNLTIEVNLQNVFLGSEASFPTDSIMWNNWFQNWLENLYPDIPEADSYELTLRLSDDIEIQSLNAQYRGKNQPTDVLAFAALEADIPQPECEPLYLGDIVISIETAQKQALQQGHSLFKEIVWLASHGFLHLLGWDHPDEESLNTMLSQQETLLKVISLIP